MTATRLFSCVFPLFPINVLNYLKRELDQSKQAKLWRCLPMNFATLLISCLFAWSAVPLFAQKPAIVPAPTPAATDSTQQVRSASDTIPATIQRNGRSGVPVKVGNSVLVEDDSTSLDNPDTVRITAKQEAQIHKIIPKQATIRSLILPGLGQAYNRQYYKIPFIYAGFGVMGYLFIKYRALAKEAEIGYSRLLYGDQISDEPYLTLDPGMFPVIITNPIATPSIKVDQVLIGVGPFTDRKVVITTTATAKNAYDTYRRYRDLNLLLSAALWALNIVEANVAAHLKTFDLTDDISMRVEPNVLPMPGTGFVPGVRVAFTFK